MAKTVPRAVTAVSGVHGPTQIGVQAAGPDQGGLGHQVDHPPGDAGQHCVPASQAADGCSPHLGRRHGCAPRWADRYSEVKTAIHTPSTKCQ